MCGRYALAAPADELIEAFDIGALTFDYFARFNIAPGQDVLVVAEDRNGRRAGLLNWGLVPSWSDGSHRPMINARAESVSTKPSFREAFDRRRCLVPASGFYEWQKPEGGGPKRPHWFSPSGRGVVSFGAIWETWRRPGLSPKHTLAILTTDANEDVTGIHHRMPVVVTPERRERWLARDVRGADVEAMLRPAPAGTFERWEVSPRVNRVGEDDAGLIEPS